MVPSSRAFIVMLALVATAFAGCISAAPESLDTASATNLPVPGLPVIIPVTVDGLMTFVESVVKPAVGLAGDLYEPTMEVSDTGTIYVAGHVIGAATTGTPAYYSNDDGKTWAPLPFLAGIATPSPGQGSQPPPGDEGFIVAGENGQAWMADIYAAGFSITGWCDNGATQCYDNRQAYDRVESTTNCNPVSLNDRPWAAYASGSLLLVNNPGGGPMQLGIMDVPPSAPVGIAGVNGPTWNTCASPGGGIPGIPTMRADGLFAVPQMMGSGDKQVLNVVVGNKADIFAVETVEAFKVTSTGAGTSNGGRTAFGLDGTLFVGARNNTKDGDGQFILAVSSDDGKTFQSATFTVGSAVRSLYLDNNLAGPGALLTWSQVSEDKTKSDWYVAHVVAGPDGMPMLKHVSRAIEGGPHSSAHVMGAALGPDGRAYFLTFSDATPIDYIGSAPISVWVQQEGPTMETSEQTE